MVQVAIAYFALGVGVLLVLAGALAWRSRRMAAMLSPHGRRIVTGGLIGMVLFLIVMFGWLRSSLWIR